MQQMMREDFRQKKQELVGRAQDIVAEEAAAAWRGTFHPALQSDVPLQNVQFLGWKEGGLDHPDLLDPLGVPLTHILYHRSAREVSDLQKLTLLDVRNVILVFLLKSIESGYDVRLNLFQKMKEQFGGTFNAVVSKLDLVAEESGAAKGRARSQTVRPSTEHSSEGAKKVYVHFCDSIRRLVEEELQGDMTKEMVRFCRTLFVGIGAMELIHSTSLNMNAVGKGLLLAVSSAESELEALSRVRIDQVLMLPPLRWQKTRAFRDGLKEKTDDSTPLYLRAQPGTTPEIMAVDLLTLVCCAKVLRTEIARRILARQYSRSLSPEEFDPAVQRVQTELARIGREQDPPTTRFEGRRTT